MLKSSLPIKIYVVVAAQEAVAGLFRAQERLSKMRPDLAAAKQVCLVTIAQDV